jgi:DNA repair protein RadA
MTKKKLIDIFNLKDVPKLGPIGIQKLENAGVFSKTDMLVFSWVDIAEWTGMTKDDAEAAVQYCRNTLQDAGIQPKTEMNGLQVLEEREKLKRWPTGSLAVDELIGQIEAGSVTEFSGKFGSGKTQFSHSLCVTICMEDVDKKSPPNRVLYIDTEGTFRPERIKEITEARKGDYKKVLENIIIMKAQDAAHQMVILENAVHLIEELNIKCVILDSATALFRQELAEYGAQGTKSRKLNKFVHLMSSIAEIFKIPVIAVNQVYDSSDPFSPGQKIYGGNVWGHAMTYRIGLKVKKKGREWLATTIDFPNKPVADALFVIKKEGIVDLKKKEPKK